MKHSKVSPHRPLRSLIYFTSLLNRKKFAKKHGLTIDRSALEGVEPPYIVLFNHVGAEDHYFVGMTLYPNLANYMVSRWVAHSFPTGPLSALAGAIHKVRFVPDVEAVVGAKRVLKDRRGIVAIAPAASYSIDGTPNYFDYGIAKLVKHFKLPVFVVKMNGLYMFRNRFRSDRQQCRVESRVERVFNGPELADMQLPDIFKTLYEACDFNDFQYQEHAQAEIKADRGDIAEGMEYVAYKCLCCGAEFTMQASGDTLRCSECGNTVRVNDRYFFEPTSVDTVYVRSLDRWNRIQKRCLTLELEKEDFSISSPCTISHYTEHRRFGFTEYGSGVLRLDRSGFTYTGTDKGKEVEYRYPLADTPYVGSDAKKYLSFDSYNDVCRYKLSDMRMATKFLLALRIMRLKYYPDFPGEYEWYNGLPTVAVDDKIIGQPKVKLPGCT